ncbi:MAG: tetratricopeptide repeat protein [bacterium]
MQQNIGTNSKGVQAEHINTVIMQTSPVKHNGKIPKHLTKLPAKNEHFVGRKQELAQLKNDLARDGTVYIVNGIGGVGKSELANKYLLDHEARYQHIALFELTNSETPLRDTLYAALKELFFLDNDSTLDQIIHRLQHLPKKCLLVFDDLKNKADIASLKPLNYNCDVLITTRLQISDATCLNLAILNPDDARQLFLTYYPTDETIDDILEYIDYHSLFIELIAKTLQEGYLILNELREKFSKGEFTQIERDFEQTFNNFLRQRFAIEQQPALKTLLQQLAILPPIAIEYAVLAEIFTDTQRLKLMLAELAKRGWLIKKDNSYKLHQIIKEFILANHKLDFDEIIPKAIKPDKIDDIEIIDAILAAYPKAENVDIAILRNTQGVIYYYLGQYDKAFHTWQIALKIRETQLGEHHPDTASTYNNLAMVVYHVQSKFDQAIELHEKALSIRETLLGEHHSDTTDSYNNLAIVYQDQGKLAQALPLHQKALTIREKLLGEQHPKTADSYNNLAIVYQDQGKLAQAIDLHEKALSIREALLGEQHPDTASTYNNLASLYKDQGELAQAIELHEKALTIRETLLGEYHLDTACSYNNLAAVYDDQGKFEQAITLHQKALMIYENLLGEHHSDTADSYNNLANVYYAQGKLDQALSLFQKALTIREILLGEHHPDTASSYNNLAAVYNNQGKFDQALTLHQKALTTCENVLGEQHPDTANSYNNLACVYYAQGKLAQAIELHEKALTIRETLLGEQHPDTATSYNNLANVYNSQSKWDQAIDLYEKALAIYKTQLGAQHPNTIIVYNNLARVYKKTKKRYLIKATGLIIIITLLIVFIFK